MAGAYNIIAGEQRGLLVRFFIIIIGIGRLTGNSNHHQMYISILVIISISVLTVLSGRKKGGAAAAAAAAETFAGNRESADKLNATLIKVSQLLNQNRVKDWFIGYGTLLGIVRNRSS